jgi:hypothetical protein
MPVLEEKPAGVPITVPALPLAKPSQILRSHPSARWCAEKLRRTDDTGAQRFCAIGRLADAGGFTWSEWDGRNCEYSNASVFVRRLYGFTFNQITAIMLRNDRHGLDEVIRFLEERGK